MKKITILILLAALLAALTACGATVTEDIASERQAQPEITFSQQYDLGVRYLSEGNYEEAILAFTAAINIDPKNADAYIGRAEAYIFSGETEDSLALALADYEAAMKLDDADPAPYLGIADIYIREGRYEEAYELLKTALDLTGGNADIAAKIAEMESGTYTDSSNNIRRSNRYDLDGTLESYTEYDYDFLGRRIGWRNIHIEDGEAVLSNYCVVTIGENGLPERNQFYEADGSESFHDYMEFDELGRETRRSRYDADENLDHYFIFYYNERGDRSSYERYDANGVLGATWIYIYDDNGSLIREEHYEGDELKGYETHE